MKHLFVPYELALKLKEKGFDEPCLRVYCEKYEINPKTGGDIRMGEFYLTDTPHQKSLRCKAPLYQQVIDWFREKHKLVIVCTAESNYYKGYEGSVLYTKKAGGIVTKTYQTYYEALTKAIEEALKLI